MTSHSSASRQSQEDEEAEAEQRDDADGDGRDGGDADARVTDRPGEVEILDDGGLDDVGRRSAQDVDPAVEEPVVVVARHRSEKFLVAVEHWQWSGSTADRVDGTVWFVGFVDCIGTQRRRLGKVQLGVELVVDPGSL